MLNVAVVGAGYGGYGLAPGFLRAGATVVGLVAPSGTRRDATAAKLGIPHTASSLPALAAIADFDAVAIAVPPEHQAGIAQWALERGHAVFAEKPLGVTLAETETLANLAERRNVVTAVDFLFPELPAWRVAHHLVQCGALGPLLEASVTWRFQSYDNRNHLKGWKSDARRGGGALRHFGSHTLYYLHWLIGPLTNLTSTLPQGHEDEGDTLAAFHGFADGAIPFSATICNDDPDSGFHVVRLIGRRGQLALKATGSNPVDFTLTCRETEQVLETSVSLPPGIDPRVAPISRIAARFLSAVAAGSRMTPSFADGLTVQRHIERLTKFGN